MYQDGKKNEPKELPGFKFFINFHPGGKAHRIQGTMDLDGLFRIPKGNLTGEHRVFAQYAVQSDTQFLVYNEAMEIIQHSGPPNSEEIGLKNYNLDGCTRILQVREGVITLATLTLKVKEEGARVEQEYKQSLMKNGHEGFLATFGDLAVKMAAGYRAVMGGKSGLSPRRIYSRTINQCGRTA